MKYRDFSNNFEAEGYRLYIVKIIGFLLLFFLLLPSCGYAAETLKAAVAANFMLPMNEYARIFEEKTGIRVEPTYTSTGNLYGQIVKGAPYDVFFAADEKRPLLLFESERAEKPFVYAQGLVIHWTAKQKFGKASGWQAVVRGDEVRTIAIANTENAPYGTAAMIALQKAGLWEALAGKYVFPQTIAQAFQYAFTQSADAGFCAYSSALSDKGSKGCYYEVPEAPPIVQAACILKRTENKTAAEKFMEFVSSPSVAGIKEKYGYR